MIKTMKLKKKKMIETTEEMREMYLKHILKLDKYVKRDFTNKTCYMCKAANLHPKAKKMENLHYAGDCNYCPLPGDGSNCSFTMRAINLKSIEKNGPSTTSLYEWATSKSIAKHRDWIQEQIEGSTDCEFYLK